MHEAQSFLGCRYSYDPAGCSFDCERHIGLLPVVDSQGKPIGVIRLSDILTLELPDFFNLLPDLDFVHDFGAVETTRPTAVELELPVTTLAATFL